MSKASDTPVYCCACSPFKRFLPPNAAQQVFDHYEIGIHERTAYADEVAVRVD